MAGDWIKWTVGLTRKPEVLGMARRLGKDRRFVAGCLMELWEWMDQVSCDGHADYVTFDDVDGHVGVEGFAGSMAEVGWLRRDGEGLSLPNFERHNGTSAKSRALATERKRLQRGRNGEAGGASRGQRDGV